MLVSAKQPASLEKRDWYPYYAGFTEAFVNSVATTFFRDAPCVLDPWSGSGTTTAACGKLGLKSIGVDLNPALTVIAKARLTPLSESSVFEAGASTLLAAAREDEPTESQPHDLLRVWIQPGAVCRLRAVQRAIHRTVLPRHPPPHLRPIALDVDTLPKTACFYYSALFFTVRNLLARFRTSNPMWLKTPQSDRHRVTPSWTTISRTFRSAADYLRARLSYQSDQAPHTLSSFKTGTATDLPFSDSHFDAALTSPPYATRLDYVMGTLPELAVLGADKNYITNLRSRTTGSPVVRSATANTRERLQSQSATNTLTSVSSHASKGSRRYYMPWLRNYLVDLQRGLFEIHRTVTPRGTLCLVVQDSYYKEHRIALQRIVTEVLESRGRPLSCRYDRPVRTPRNQTSIESLLVFRSIP